MNKELEGQIYQKGLLRKTYPNIKGLLDVILPIERGKLSLRIKSKQNLKGPAGIMTSSGRRIFQLHFKKWTL